MLIKVKFAELSYSQFDRRQVRSAFGKASRAMAARLKTTVGGGGSGAVYRVRGRTYTASGPGSPPVKFTGNLLKSMRGRASRRGYALVVSAVAPHAALLELGTARMEPRPYFEPTFSDTEMIVGLLRAAYATAPVATPGSPGSPPATVEIN
jgi:hypothetical protein